MSALFRERPTASFGTCACPASTRQAALRTCPLAGLPYRSGFNDSCPKKERRFPHRHLLSCEQLSAPEITFLLDIADDLAEANRARLAKRDILSGRSLINLFFEASTRTQASFEMAAKRLGADVLNMNVSTSSVTKGETLIDTAVTLNAMRPDIIVVRHHAAGAVELLSQKVDCSVVNAGDGAHQHPTQALLDALTIRRAKGRVGGLTVAICGDILHSRVARSNINVLNTLGANVRIVALDAAARRLRPAWRPGLHRYDCRHR